jgi:hypothetical protein
MAGHGGGCRWKWVDESYSLGNRCLPLPSVTTQPNFSFSLYSSFPSSYHLPPCPSLCQLDFIPVWVDDLEQIRLEHILVQDFQMVGDEVVCLQRGGILIHLEWG